MLKNSIPPTSSKTYPYPEGEHNGAVGPKYASEYKCETDSKIFEINAESAVILFDEKFCK